MIKDGHTRIMLLELIRKKYQEQGRPPATSRRLT